MPHISQKVDHNHNIDKEALISDNNNIAGVEPGQTAAIGNGETASSTDNRRFVASFNRMVAGPPEGMTSVPVPVGEPDFLLPVEAFFFSGFRCFESLS